MRFDFSVIEFIRLFSNSSIYVLVLATLLAVDASANSERMRRLRPSADEQPVIEVADPRLNNPVSPSEKDRGKRIADGSDKVRLAKQRQLRRAKPRALENLEDVQFLYIERHDEGKNADPRSRKADVHYYDYSKNQAIKVVVDLNNNSVEETRVAAGVNHQPFITRAEVLAGMRLIFNHPQMGTALRKAYQDITGRILSDVNQLDAQGGIYFPDKHSKLGVLAADCGSERCMQLFIPIDDKHFIDATNVVVNLSSGEVLWVKEGINGHSD